jgi:hypothetical protein
VDYYFNIPMFWLQETVGLEHDLLPTILTNITLSAATKSRPVDAYLAVIVVCIFQYCRQLLPRTANERTGNASCDTFAFYEVINYLMA